MYHGDPAHSGVVHGSPINRDNVHKLKVLHDVPVRGPIISVPALVDGFVYVGLANYLDANGGNGGQFRKINATTGLDACRPYEWDIDPAEGDAHGFMGMGCTPAVCEGRVYFSALNGKIYCLDAETLCEIWVTDLRRADPKHNQPVWNVGGRKGDPPAACWCSPVVANNSVYVGIGEGENPALFGFVYSLDARSGDVNWIYCTCQFVIGRENEPDELPPSTVRGHLGAKFKTACQDPPSRGCSVWSAIAYDERLDRLFCSTGNPNPDDSLPTAKYSNGILALSAATGRFEGFFQAPPGSSYRADDRDVDFGGSSLLFSGNGQRFLAAGCKNGGFFVLDAETLSVVNWRQLLPVYNDGTLISTVDKSATGENFSGIFSTPALHAESGSIYVGLGGPNYHDVHSGIDNSTTPFMRALDWETLDDRWDLDDGDPAKYVRSQPPMYQTPGESGLGSPTLVGDVVIMSTTKVALYAFDVSTGDLLWHDHLGQQTGGASGGYGYCVGAAISGSLVVAGGLVFGRGGVLRIYSLDASEDAERPVSFAADIVPAFRQFRGSMIWRLDLTNYDHVRANAETIRKQIENADMPPKPLSLTKAQINAFRRWMDTGYQP
jgi:outer membrane protein assembly factor BamB